MVRIILIRHGETQWNIEGRYQGQEDTQLSERGILQGHMVAEGLRNISIDAAVSSPLERSYMTCSFCAELHHLTVQRDERLLEINHGAWEGCLADEIKARYPTEFQQWHTAPQQVTMPGKGGESLEDVRVRVRDAFNDYAHRYDGKTLLVAAHDAVNKAVICDVMGLDMSHFWQIKQDNTCINVLECQQGQWRIVLLNSTNHMGYLFSGIEQKGL
ncbi:phosphoglycerate mutase [Megasphaera cerevisiae DSM 20462]|uniref:Phosphoglycerate mutase n=1 Tax=Megasphaera cerevisiae DSM 20462 TaxID=1122219 RepID=A0A0J6WT48_9FIRM|nr:histidine phosphatase family protein [Megasphaera cerevisiae]KMO86690.1 phosphoglycerate mutase [Megasphaera cerevisiae DSM 20462]OKY53288.1 histidine phosphatase family protein [Megasphaera cerevisiae]SJZ86646.1 probable phosphoglycerate mutase [Megasphaera cerevisiae DSM 20462]